MVYGVLNDLRAHDRKNKTDNELKGLQTQQYKDRFIAIETKLNLEEFIRLTQDKYKQFFPNLNSLKLIIDKLKNN